MTHPLIRTIHRIGIKTLRLLSVLLFLGAGLAQAQTTPCGTTTWDLTAGQTTNVGTVTVSNDLDNLYVTYTLTYPGATLGTLHLWVGNDLLTLPKAGNGAPIPGQFPYQQDATGATAYTFTVPFTDLLIQDANGACGLPLYVVTHAEVDMDGIPGGEHETAFGGPTAGSGPRWWFYGVYTVCCDFGPPPVETCATAYGKGGYVFTTDRKSNPESLPSLALTRNRWGWAIKLAGIGTTTYDLWAGAGLNNTGNGVKVGTVTVVWDGSTATVTYTITASGYHLKETHVYAGDDAPATIAPGQYGNTGYLFGYESTATYTVPLVDANGGGVWVVAHAVVCR
jgi:hypothetical protein